MIKKEIEIDQLKLTYYTSGKGKPVLFLHGGRLRALTHKKNIELLAQKYLVIAPDIPCFGESATPKDVWEFTDFANFFNKFLVKLNLKNITVIGYSSGGGIAFNLAAVSNRVSRLVLVNAVGQGSVRKSNTRMQVQRMYFYLTHPKYLTILLILMRDYFYNSLKHFKNINHINTIRQKCHLTTYNNLHRITIPTLILWSNNDTNFPINIAKSFNKNIKNSQMDIIDGNHDWILYNPTLFDKKTVEFIK